MSLKFKGNRKPEDIIRQTLKGKAASNKPEAQKRTYSQYQDYNQQEDQKDQNAQKEQKQKSNEQEKPQKVDKDDQIIQDLTRKTKSELAFDVIKKKRLVARIDEKLKTNYKKKIEELNKTLTLIPVHFDIPRVGPG